MINAKRKEAWTHTSALIALVHNALSKESKSPDDFNPYIKKKEIRKIKVSDLKNILFDENGKFRGGGR